MSKKKTSIILTVLGGVVLIAGFFSVFRQKTEHAPPDPYLEVRKAEKAEIDKLKAFRPDFFKSRQVKPYTHTDKGAEYLFLALEYCKGDVKKLKKEFEMLYDCFTTGSRAEWVNKEPLILEDLDGDGEAEVLVDTSRLWGGYTDFLVCDKVGGKAKVHEKLIDNLEDMNISVKEGKDGGREIILTSIEDWVEEVEKDVWRKGTLRAVYRFTGEAIEEVSPVTRIYGPAKPLDSPEFEGLRRVY